MAAAPELDLEQWHRQLLQRDRQLTVEAAVEEAAGLYSTAPTSYLSCAARIPGFGRADLDRALYEDRTLVKIGALRGSGFLIPIDRIDVVVSSRDRLEWYSGAVDKLIGEEERALWTSRLLGILEGRVLPAREIRREMDLSGREAEALRYLLSSLTHRRVLVAASGPPGWRSNQHGYARWEEWFPDHPAVEVDPVAAREDVARWYLGGHGPATVEDFAWWSGLKRSNATAALEAVAGEVGSGLFDLAGREPPPPAEGLRLLPIWDTAIVTQKSRRRMVDPDIYRLVYDGSGNATSTIVADGHVIGVWDRSGDDTTLKIEAAFFAGKGPVDLVESEAEVLATALGVSNLEVRIVDRTVDLVEAPRNRFMSPLSGD